VRRVAAAEVEIVSPTAGAWTGITFTPASMSGGGEAGLEVG
jgi:hypothetical protein